MYISINSTQGFPFLHILSSICYLLTAILTGPRCYLVVTLICISLMMSGFEHLVMYLLAIYIFGKTCLSNIIFNIYIFV